MFRSLFSRTAKGSPGPVASGSIPPEAAQLIERAAAARPDARGPLFNRAGDLCAQTGFATDASALYGRAVDAYLDGGLYDAAGALCRKLLRENPGAVRTHCTLAWLEVAAATSLAADAVDGYAGAADQAGARELAVRQLRRMGRAAADAGLRERIAERLLDLGDGEGSDRLFGVVFAERNRVRKPDFASPEARWAFAVRSALLSPEELRASDDEERPTDTEITPELPGGFGG